MVLFTNFNPSRRCTEIDGRAQGKITEIRFIAIALAIRRSSQLERVQRVGGRRLPKRCQADSCSIPLTEYYMDLSSTLKGLRRHHRRQAQVTSNAARAGARKSQEPRRVLERISEKIRLIPAEVSQIKTGKLRLRYVGSLVILSNPRAEYGE